LPVTNPDNYKNGKLVPEAEDIISMQNKIRMGYSDFLQKRTGSDNYKYLMAVNAYVSLKYFDDFLQNIVGKTIRID
jgi:hypothetical protein